MSIRARGGLALTMVVSGLIAAGCGSSTTSSSGNATSNASASSGGNTACMNQASQVVAQATKPVQLQMATTPVNFGKISNKNVWFISTSQAIPG